MSLGIRLILSKEPKTAFKEVGRHFVVAFKRKTTLKTTPKTADLIIELIKREKQITKEKLAQSLGITVNGIKYHIRKLRRKKSLVWKGPMKGGHWELKQR